jgi:ATP-binding protein involved in chromosome partitioning
MELFGSGGGQAVADSLTRSVGSDVPLLGQIPIDTRLREGGDAGVPLVLSAPQSAAGEALRGVADRLTVRARGLAGMSLNISPAGR